MRYPDNLENIIQKAAKNQPEKVYLADARSNRTIAYGQLDKIYSAWKRFFNFHLDDRKKIVIMAVADPILFAALFVSAIASGARVLVINADSIDTELKRVLPKVKSDVGLIISDKEIEEVSGIKVVNVKTNALLPKVIPMSFDDKLSTGSVIMFTSGSTGEPKGVELSEFQLLHTANCVAKHNQLTKEDIGYNPLPLSHINAEVVSVLASLLSGSMLILDKKFHRTAFWNLLKERKVTWFNAVPAILAILATSGEMEIPSTLRFIRSASAPLPDIVRNKFKGIELIISYGMTEAGSQITATPMGAWHRPSSVGVPVGVSLEIRDDENNKLPFGKAGMVWIKGPGVISRYLNGLCADRFDTRGWLKTGDVGRVDNEGFVYLLSRNDDIINRGGEKLYPADIEEVLLEDNRVREAVVVSRHDVVLSQVPIAYIITADDGGLDVRSFKNDLEKLCQNKLPKFKQPVDIIIVNDLPRTAAGKIQRNRVREMAEKRATD